MRKPVAELTEEELKAELSSYGFTAGPITGTTRGILQKKLDAFRSGAGGTISKPAKTSSTKKAKTVQTTPESQAVLSQSAASHFGVEEENDHMESSPILSPQNRLRPSVGSYGQSAKRTTPVESFKNFGLAEEDDHMESSRILPSQNRSTKKARTVETTPGSSASLSYAGHVDFEEEDDHMESSRILSPQNRFRPSIGSYGKSAKKTTPVENFKKMAWGFFSRPLGTSTPCSEDSRKSAGFGSSKYRRTSTPFAVNFDTKKISPDLPRWISRAVIVFFIVLFFAYIARAHPEVVYNGMSATGDLIVASFHFLYNYAIMPAVIFVLVSIILFGLYKLIIYRNQKKSEENRKLMLLVERITDLIYEAGNSGIAEPHVRDMLMPPTKRSEAEYKRWQEAARFINNEDSRIRTEIRLISGTECNVWIWVGAGKQRWQGTAVLEGSPLARIPERALARCLKLRGISFSSNAVERESIRRELLAKLRPIVPKHIGFVGGPDSVIYVMLKDLNDAKRAFLAFHSHWFNGNLLSAKYVRDQRYLERFPDAEK